jgi:hypothetical protein
MKTKVYITALLLVAIIVAIMISSAAWFSANSLVDTTITTVTAADSLRMTISVPNDHANPDSYLGQTGVQYNGLDSPYVLKYYPVQLQAVASGSADLFMYCDISAVSIQSIIEDEPLVELNENQILSNFTWRFGVPQVSTVFNPETGEYEERVTEKIYKNNNGFLFSEEGEPFAVQDGAAYNFTLYLYFLGEEGYELMQQTNADIPDEYIFAYSDISYMWATFYITISIGIKGLYRISFDSMGGTPCDSIPTTGGNTILLPTTQHTDQSKYFGGWYDNPSFVGDPFEVDTLTRRPRRTDFTLYARWLDKPAVRFDANGWWGVLPPTQYVMPGDTASDPQTADIIAWTTTPMTYQQYVANPVPFDFENTTIHGDLTLYAVWRTRHLITLHMDTVYSGYLVVDGVTYNSTYTFYVYDGDTIPNIYHPEPDSSIREFKRWSTKGDALLYTLAPQYDFSTVITGPVHLYAYYGI